MSEEERANIAQFELQIAELNSQNVARQLKKRRQELTDLEKLVRAIREADLSVSDTAVAETEGLVREVNARSEEARLSGIEQFQFARFTQVGSEVWRRFVAAAKALADAEAMRGTAYPEKGDHCLLCQQTLSAEAMDLINRTWSFVNSDAQTRLDTAKLACTDRTRELASLDLGYLANDLSARGILESDLPTIIPMLESHVAACSERRREMIDSLRAQRIPSPPPSIHINITDINRLVQLRQIEISQLEISNVGERLIQLETALRELKHRRTLSELIEKIESHVEGKKWVVRARQALGSTQNITKKYNDLFKELVTDRYINLFRDTLKLFKSNMKVTIQAWGKKGETVRQIVLSPEAFPLKYPVEKILSDGEKRAVAIADFLTEATLDESCKGIIFDDPVNSLDNNWKQILAKCLAEHAKIRQVVVFTHDLPLLYHLKERADEIGLDVLSHWVRAENGRPGYVYFDNSPECERNYKKAEKARRCYAEAKDAQPAEQQLILQQGFGALRTSYEALVIFDVFNNVVARFEERISLDRLKDVHIDQQLLNEIIKRVGILSRYIDAHLHSDAYSADKPNPAVLLEEIESFEKIKKRQKDLGKDQTVG